MHEPTIRALDTTKRVWMIPVWLVVHREIRSSRRIRAVYDFLARELPHHFE